MSTRGWIWTIGAVTVAVALAGCGAAAIPDDEIAGMVGSSTAGMGGDAAALSIFAGGTPVGPSKSFSASNTITVTGVGSLAYNYTIDYLEDGSSVEDPISQTTWDEVTLDGSAHLFVDLPYFDADRTLDVDLDVTGFHDGPDGRVTLNGTTVAAGTATWTNPANDVTAGYTMDLTRTWTHVNIADPTNPVLPWYPTSGTIVITGSVERHRESPSGLKTGSWSGTVTITFDGDWIVPVDVNGSSYQLNLLTGEVTAGT